MGTCSSSPDFGSGSSIETLHTVGLSKPFVMPRLHSDEVPGERRLWRLVSSSSGSNSFVRSDSGPLRGALSKLGDTT